MNQQPETVVQRELRIVVESFGERYVVDGILKKDAIITDLDNYNEELITRIMSNEVLNEKFTQVISEVMILKTNELIQLLETDEYWRNSYTRYTNKIGLTHAGRYISDSSDVVLDFPYKDTVLKAGMTKEDVSKEDAEESFLNEIVAREEIDVLLDKKMLKNIKKYDEQGESEVSSLGENDNLIIKGNNLLALHSLKERYAGKVKLIYIDPPYNTGSDSFNYNDNFNHSTWLTFMKNRLEVARELLSEDGLIWVQTDDGEVNYLGVLLDEIFGRGNFINLITVKTKIGGVSGSSEGKSLKDATEFIQVYAKKKELINLKPIFAVTPVWEYIQSEYIETGKSWKYTSVLLDLGKKILIKSDNDSERTYYHYPNAKTCSVKEYAKINGLTEEEVYNTIPDRIFQTTNAQSSVRTTLIEATKNYHTGFVSVSYIPIKGKNQGRVTEILYTNTKRMVMLLSDMLTEDSEGNLLYKEKLTTLWDSIQYNNLSKEGMVDFPNGKKPEKLLQNIIEMCTNGNDLVMDFFSGSGTTAAVAHKMNRKYIVMEQIDEQMELTLQRLQNVIDGDPSGISNNVDWQGGGSFIYAELMDKNSTFIDLIVNAHGSEQLKHIFDEMKETLDFDFHINLQEVSHSIWEEDFETQRKVLIKIIDKNLLYHNYFEIDDEKVKSQLTREEYEFNKNFYGE